MSPPSRHYFFLIILLSCSIIASYASPILKYQFDHAKSDTARLSACVKLIKSYIASLKNDSCLVYINQGMELVKRTKNTTYHAEFYKLCGRFFNNKEQPELVIGYLKKGKYWAIKNKQIRQIGIIDYELAALYSEVLPTVWTKVEGVIDRYGSLQRPFREIFSL